MQFCFSIQFLASHTDLLKLNHDFKNKPIYFFMNGTKTFDFAMLSETCIENKRVTLIVRLAINKNKTLFSVK